MSTRSIAETKLLRKLGLAFTVALTLLLVGFVLLSLTYQPRSRRFPLLVAVPALLCMLLIVLSYFSDRAERTIAKFNAALFESDAEILDEDEDEIRERLIGKSIAWTVGMLVAYYLFGFVSMTFAFVYAYLTVEGGHERRRSALIAILSTAFTYALFVLAFGVRLDGGAVTMELLQLFGV